MADRPSPKAKRLDDTGHRAGWAKSPFVNMRNQVVGTWHVVEYLYALDQATLDSDWTEHFWQCRCVQCGTEAILERRYIRGRSQKKCPVCVASQKAERVRHETLKKLRVKPQGRKPKVDWAEIRRLTHEKTAITEIAKQLGCATGTVVNAQQRMGLKRPRVSVKQYKETLRVPVEVQRGKAAKRRRVEKLERLVSGKTTWKHLNANGRVVKYGTNEERMAARRPTEAQRKARREAYRLSKGLSADAVLKRTGRPRKYA